MTVDWPFGCVIEEGYSTATALLVTRTAFRAGARVRRAYKESRDRFPSVSAILSAQEWFDFQTWYRDTARNGAERVNLPVFSAGEVENRECVFVTGSIQHSLFAVNSVRLTFSVEAFVPQVYDEETYEYIKGWGGAQAMWLALQAMETMVNSPWLSE